MSYFYKFSKAMFTVSKSFTIAPTQFVLVGTLRQIARFDKIVKQTYFSCSMLVNFFFVVVVEFVQINV